VAAVGPAQSHEAQQAVNTTATEGDALVGAMGLRAQRPPDRTADHAVPRMRWPMPLYDVDGWLAPLAVVTVMGVGAGVIVSGLPPGTAGAGVLGLLLLTAALSAVALSRRVRDLRLAVPALVGVGMCGAGLDLQADGPGFIASYMSLMGLALRTPRRVAVMAGVPVVAAISVEETYQSVNPTSTVLTVIFASGLLFICAAFAAVCQDRGQHAEALLAQEAATSAARQQAAALAERSRLARDLHDVLAHNLCALAVQLEATRLAAISMGAGEKLVEQVASARRLACIGMVESRRALQLLRDGQTPDVASLPGLVSETSAMLGVPATFRSRGVQCQLGDGAGLALYRVVQEALTNVAKHSGRGAEVTVGLSWAHDGVEVSIIDCGGDGVGAGLPSSGHGLSGMAERVSLIGGRLSAGPVDGGFAVHLWLPSWPQARGQPG
jgi:signal transduction histidine kinase